MNDYRVTDLPDIILTLTEDFETACDVYKGALENRTSNRAVKELIRGNTKGTAIHRFQCQFSWTIHELVYGPQCFIDSNIRRLHDLVEHINKSSES